MREQDVLIREKIDRRNIKWLCHFTPQSNLENIKRYGLLMRHELPGQVTITDTMRADKASNAICMTISKPNKWMFEKKQREDHNLALLLISPDVLFMRKCLFYPHNAATASLRKRPVEEFMTIDAFKNLFAEEVSYQKSGCNLQTINRNNHNPTLDAVETTSDQAEVQCLEQISPQHIMRTITFNIPLTYQDVQILANKLYLNPQKYRNLPANKLSYPKPDNRDIFDLSF